MGGMVGIANYFITSTLPYSSLRTTNNKTRSVAKSHTQDLGPPAARCPTRDCQALGGTALRRTIRTRILIRDEPVVRIVAPPQLWQARAARLLPGDTEISAMFFVRYIWLSTGVKMFLVLPGRANGLQ